MSWQIDLGVAASVGHGDGLDIALTNISTEPLRIYRHSLPWVGWNSLLLVAVRTDGPGTVLAKTLRIDDPGPEEITVAPGQTLTGSISIRDRFSAFMDAIQSRDVIVFWSYQCQPIQGAPLPRVSGAIVFASVGKSAA